MGQEHSCEIRLESCTLLTKKRCTTLICSSVCLHNTSTVHDGVHTMKANRDGADPLTTIVHTTTLFLILNFGHEFH